MIVNILLFMIIICSSVSGFALGQLYFIPQTASVYTYTTIGLSVIGIFLFSMLFRLERAR